jgi:hypothetical protein
VKGGRAHEAGWPEARRESLAQPQRAGAIGGCPAPTPLPTRPGDALRTGTYSKTLTFTLSTTNP